MFKIGDKVKHKSGGPVMVVSWVKPEPTAQSPFPYSQSSNDCGCRWWNKGRQEYSSTAFMADELVKVEEETLTPTGEVSKANGEDVDKEYTRIVEEQYAKRAERKEIARKAEEAPVINRDLENWLDWLRKEYESKEKEYKFPDYPVVPKPYCGYTTWTHNDPPKFEQNLYPYCPPGVHNGHPYKIDFGTAQRYDTPTWLKVK